MKRAVLVAAILGVFALWSPAAEPELAVCGFRWLTGLDCPLCGLTRALCSLMKADWTAAVRFHALSPAVLIFLAASAAQWPRRVVAAATRVMLAALAIYGVGRNF